jgi:hypothetical protein
MKTKDNMGEAERTGLVDAPIGRNRHAVLGRATVEGEVHRLHVPFLEGHGSTAGREKAEGRGEGGERILHGCCLRVLLPRD